MTSCTLTYIVALLAMPASVVLGVYGAVLIYRKHRSKRPRSRVRATHIYKP